jgi:hypothetical protein
VLPFAVHPEPSRSVQAVPLRRPSSCEWARGDWLGGPIPDGYRSDGAKSIKPDPDPPLMRRIFELSLACTAPAALARELNAKGLRTHPATRGRAGASWVRSQTPSTNPAIVAAPR